jgi:imidazolonepropionase-like amidohydrolase
METRFRMTAARRSMLILLALAPACRRPPAEQVTALMHVTVVDVERGALLPDRTVLVRGGRIERVDTALRVTVPRAARLVDGSGRFLLPGLWDMHVHLDDARTVGQLLGWGVTGARIMSGGLDATLALRQRSLTDPRRSPRLTVVGLALHGLQSFAADTGLAVVRTADDGRRAVDSLAARRVDFIKVHEGLSRQAWFAIARAAREHGIPLTGHVPEGLTPEEASDSGLRSIEHLEFLPDRCLVLFDSSARASLRPPPAGCRPPDLSRLVEHLHRNRVWLDPTISSFRVFAARQWPSILAGFADVGALIRRVLAGTDLGSSGIVPGESLHDELALLVQAGFSPAEALRAATLNPATMLGMADSLGRVRAGAVADLVLLDGNPLADIRNTRRIAGVFRAGTLLRRAVLDSLRR